MTDFIHHYKKSYFSRRFVVNASPKDFILQRFWIKFVGEDDVGVNPKNLTNTDALIIKV